MEISIFNLNCWGLPSNTPILNRNFKYFFLCTKNKNFLIWCFCTETWIKVRKPFFVVIDNNIKTADRNFFIIIFLSNVIELWYFKHFELRFLLEQRHCIRMERNKFVAINQFRYTHTPRAGVHLNIYIQPINSYIALLQLLKRKRSVHST